MNLIGPLLSPDVVKAIEKKAQPSFLSQLFGAAVVSSMSPRTGSAPIVNANMAPPRSGSALPLLVIGGLALFAVIALVGRRRG